MSHYSTLRAQIPSHVQIVCVSKHQTLAQILEVYAQGCRDFAESRIQEWKIKAPQLPRDIRWHYIGTLQTKKIPQVAGAFHLIHSIDSLELAKKLDHKGIPNHVLLQVNTSGETSKQGMTPEYLLDHFDTFLSLKNLTLEGLMTMAPQTEDQDLITHTFASVRQLQTQLQTTHNIPHLLQTLSMGMSQDYLCAIEQGANCVRIGRAIFAKNSSVL